MRAVLVLLTAFFSSQAGFASDFITFEEGAQPHFENEDYEVWVMSLLNEKDNTYVNLSIFPKRRFRHHNYHKLKKSDRTDIVSAWNLKLVEKDSINVVIGVLPFVGLDSGWATIEKKPYFFDEGRIETSANLNDKEINHITLKFGGHISSETKMICLNQNGDEKYFHFTDIPVSIPHHEQWIPKYKSEQELIAIIESSQDPICGIYEQNEARYACVLEGNTYKLIRLNDSQDMTWRFGDERASFNKTAVPGAYKGNYRNIYTKENKKDCSFIWNGDFLEIMYKYTVPGYWFMDFYVPLKEEEAHETYTKIYSASNNRTSSNDSEQWSGSGFALLNGYVVTNNHVADDASEIQIYGIDGDFTTGYKAKVIGKDKVCDIALLQIVDYKNDKYWESVPYSISKTMADVGESIYALGYPLIGTMGEEVKLTTGIISSRSGFEGDVTNYQISAPIQPGNSGGPLFNENGELVGIICAKHTGAENAGYAIKTSYLFNLIESVADTNIIPTNNELKGLSLKNQVKILRDYTFLIKCTK